MVEYLARSDGDPRTGNDMWIFVKWPENDRSIRIPPPQTSQAMELQNLRKDLHGQFSQFFLDFFWNSSRLEFVFIFFFVFGGGGFAIALPSRSSPAMYSLCTMYSLYNPLSQFQAFVNTCVRRVTVVRLILFRTKTLLPHRPVIQEIVYAPRKGDSSPAGYAI